MLSGRYSTDYLTARDGRASSIPGALFTCIVVASNMTREDRQKASDKNLVKMFQEVLMTQAWSLMNNNVGEALEHGPLESVLLERDMLVVSLSAVKRRASPGFNQH
jgi:hypothetical protein